MKKFKKSIWFSTPDIEKLNENMRNTLCEQLGIRFVEAGDDFLSALMPVDARTIQPMKVLHGGASCALAETVGSAAASYCIDTAMHQCVGLDFNINYIHPIKSGFVIAIAKPLHLGRTTQVWEIRIRNTQGKLISIARLTIFSTKK